MELLPEITLKKISEVLFLNANTKGETNFKHGKIGIAICLFEIGRYSGDAIYSDLAFEIFQEGISKDLIPQKKYPEMAENSCALQYLIENKYIDASYLDIFEKEHTSILKEFKKTLSKAPKYFLGINNTIKYLLFYDSLSTLIDKQYPSLREKLINHIFVYFQEYLKENFNNNVTSKVFYFNATTLLKIMYALDHTGLNTFQELLKLIIELDKQFTNGYNVSEERLFGIILYNCCCKYNLETRFIEETKLNAISFAHNIIPGSLSFKERTDLLLYSHEKFLDRELFSYYKDKAEVSINTIIDSNIPAFEKKIFNTIIKRDASKGLGIDSGLSRLVLLHIYMKLPHKNQRILKLL